jgi:hypothetical protein
VRAEKCKPMELSGDFCDRARPFGRARVKRNKTHALADEFLGCACRRNAVSRRDECGGESEVESESRDVVRGGHTAMAGDRTCHMTSQAREREREWEEKGIKSTEVAVRIQTALFHASEFSPILLLLASSFSAYSYY